MSPEVTQAVLMDVLVTAGVALALGLVVYQLVRLCTGVDWSRDGNVLTRPYGVMDGVVALGLVGLMGWMVGVQPEGGGQELGMEEFAVGMFVGSLFFLMVALVLVAYMGVVRGMNPVEMFGLRSLSVGSALGQALLWLIGVMLVMGVVVAVSYWWYFGGEMPDESVQEVVEKFREMEHWGLRALVVVAAVVLAPVTEELIFRGFLYGVAKRFTDRWFAAILTGLFFAVVHHHVGSLLPLFLLGIGFAVAYEVTGSLLVPVLMHMMFNGFNVARMVIGG